MSARSKARKRALDLLYAAELRGEGADDALDRAIAEGEGPTNDYTVTVSAPTCVSSWNITNSYSVRVAAQAPKTNIYDIQAVVTDSRTGASATIHQGVRVDLLPYQSC